MIRHIALIATGLAVLLLTALIFILPTPNPAATSPDESSQADRLAEIYVTNVTLMQNGALQEGMTIKISDGLIDSVASDVSVSENAAIIDGTGLTALPGLLDAHTHSYGSALPDALKFGVTANVDMFSAMTDLNAARRSRDDLAAKQQADLFSAGMMATAPGGHGTQYGVPIETLDGPEDAADWVKARKAEGSDFIKLVYMPYQNRIPSLTRETANAIIDAAHAEDLKVYAHISRQQAALEMIEDGIDGLVHIFADSVATPELVALAKEKDVFIIPTLAVIASVDGQSQELWDGLSDPIKDRLSPMQRQTLKQSFPGGFPGYSFETALENTKLFHDAGVAILAGSDAPNPGTAHGISLHLEMQHLVRAGFTPEEALSAATHKVADRLHIDGRGRLDAGSRADILLVEDNPYVRISDTLRIKHIFKNGVAIGTKKASAQTRQTITSASLSDFSNSLEVSDGLGWSNTDDGMANGQSEARVELSNGTLKVVGETRTGFPFPWAGAAIGVGMNEPGLDISQYQTIQFSAKGTPGAYRLMTFSEGGPGIPPTQAFELTADWQAYEIALDRFNGFEPKLFSGFAFVAGPEATAFEFYLRDVTLK